jgi:hypothetical protein
VGNKFSPIKLMGAFFNFLAEPCVVVQVVFHELLDIFFHAAIIFTGYAGQLRLDLGIEIHFHKDSVSVELTRVKRPQGDGSRQGIVRGN